MANKPLILNDGIVLNNETLSIYDEGTWSVTDLSGAGLTITTTRAKFTRIGNICFLNAVVTFPATANATNALLSIPIATTDGSAIVQVTSSLSPNVSIGLIFSGGIALYTDAAVRRTNADLSNGTLYITGFYNIV